MKLDGKVAVVTGGAMGNGLGIVEVFLKHGADVVIIDYSDQLANTLQELNNPKAGGWMGRTQYFYSGETILYNTVMRETCNFTFAQIHRMWTLR